MIQGKIMDVIINRSISWSLFIILFNGNDVSKHSGLVDLPVMAHAVDMSKTDGFFNSIVF